MSNTKTDGPAFPRAGNEWSEMAWVEAPAENGMSLRDYFAAKAMQGMYASESFPTGLMADTAAEAYQMADAMMEARAA